LPPLLSFPTRRSSDLAGVAAVPGVTSVTFCCAAGCCVDDVDVDVDVDEEGEVAGSVVVGVAATGDCSSLWRGVLSSPASDRTCRSEEHTSELQSRENL